MAVGWKGRGWDGKGWGGKGGGGNESTPTKVFLYYITSCVIFPSATSDIVRSEQNKQETYLVYTGYFVLYILYNQY